MPIQILEEQLANKIAAGEVIERPASVVKELVENAIDAGATEITIEIEEAGRKLIRVTDNGCGMEREDAVLSLQRHATSKIASVDDLFAIRTLGFRGEALPSIASVSHLRMTTRPQQADSGTELIVHGGTITDLHEVGCPPGTQIEVAQLFYNTPARLKFLKSDQTEMAQIADLVNALSLCHHGVNMRLTHNGRETMSRPSSARMISHIAAWLGRQTAEAMVEVDLATPGVHVTGHVGKPETARGNRSGQIFFVNGRRIVNRMLTHALEYSFEGLLAPKRYPVGVLRIEVDPAQVDVNVHPAKAEVRFNREGEVHAAVVRAVKTALGAVSMVQELAMWQAAPIEGSRPVTRPVAPSYPSIPSVSLPNLGDARETVRQPLVTMPAPPVSAPTPQTGLRPIGQFHGTFLLAEGRDAMLVINQHRAHERVIFERLWSSAARVEVQRLVLPTTLHLGHRETAILAGNLDGFAAFGFEIEPMSGQSFMVRAVPAVLASVNPEIAIQGILADVEAGISIAQFTCDDPKERAFQEGRRRLLASIACKAAIKAGKLLSPQEQVELLDQLQQTAQQSICPHGAPIIMTITRYELDRKFIR
ncbi:MAG TPA: DNA mismatch repair endonuclease MutL [Armatimonadota bacterium]|nr:DNA mismatch repair endonuclease MutL [Armatimonadota bacterium]